MKYKFFVIRYIPDLLRGEFINIGIIIQPIESDRERALIRMTTDWSRVLRFDPEADVEMLEALGADLCKQIDEDKGSAETAVRFLQELSLAIQSSEARGGLAENLETELETLMSLFVNPKIGVHVTIPPPSQ